MSKQTASRVIVALDFSDEWEVLSFVEQLQPGSCRLKVGKELFTRTGPGLVRDLVQRHFDIFLDLKFHDIPNTVARACAAAADLGVWMMNVHASGGSVMMAAAREALGDANDRPLLIGVTVLTSMDSHDLQAVGVQDSPHDQVLRLASLAGEAGLDGVVCSPREVSALREQQGEAFTLVTPGIRPTGSAQGDQKRIMTPADAVTAGSDYLVIGRPITQADDPVAVLQSINDELALVE